MKKKLLKGVLVLSVISLFGCNVNIDKKPIAVKSMPVNTVARTILVTNGDQLAEAIVKASAGDVIELAAGTYTTKVSRDSFGTGVIVDDVEKTHTNRWYFGSTADGTADKPIVLRSADPTKPAIIRGEGWDKPGYVLYIRGDYWTIENIVVTEAAKGIMFDQAGHSILRGVEIHTVGQEGLHYRDGSHNALADGIKIHNVGKFDDGFGEGVYVGSDNTVWKEEGTGTIGSKGKLFGREVYNITVRNSVIGPNITAEPFDIKEGTHNIIIEDNTIYGSGVSGRNSADSFIDLKGTKASVRRNMFDFQGNAGVTRGVHVVPRNISGGKATGVSFELTGRDNFVYDNKFVLPAAINAGLATDGSDDTYMWNNVKIPHQGDLYGTKIKHAIPEKNKYQYEGGQAIIVSVHSSAVAIQNAAKLTVSVVANNKVIESIEMKKTPTNTWAGLITLTAAGTYSLEASARNAKNEIILVGSTTIDSVRYASAEFVNFSVPSKNLYDLFE